MEEYYVKVNVWFSNSSGLLAFDIFDVRVFSMAQDVL